jgi:hypothetical protein
MFRRVTTDYDLGQLADRLAATHGEIRELYIFGSRRFRTRSLRSDVDVLVVADRFIRPQALREFSDENCRALDLFLVTDGRATSSQNESYIEADDTSDLIRRLEALKFWERGKGRLEADVEWTITIREDVEFTPTALPNRKFWAKHSPMDLTLADLIASLTVPQLWAAVLAIVALVVGSAGAGYWFGTHQVTSASASPPKIQRNSLSQQRSTAKNVP